MGSIRLHPEYGVNPSLDMCFWCGEAMGVALLGYNKGKEAPRHVVSGFTPCQKCQDQMAQGITLIEARPTDPTSTIPEIQEGVQPTGRWVVMTEEAVQRIFSPEMAETLLRTRKAFMENAMFQQFLPDDQQEESA